MTEDWRTRFHRESDERIAEFVADHPGYTGPEPMEQGWSGHVARGTHRGQPVVFKVHNMHERWTNELFLYRHFAHTGFVPVVHDAVEPWLLVMDFLPGRMPRRDGIDPDVAADPDRLAALSHHLGVATGALVAAPIPTDDDGHFPPPGFLMYTPADWTEDLDASIRHYVRLGRRIGREVPSYRDPLFGRFLDLLESQIDDIIKERRVLHRRDFGNLNVVGTRVTGLYDFESVNIGAESMMVAKMLLAASEYGLDRDSVLDGYVSSAGDRSLMEHPLRLLALEQMDPFIINTCNDGRWSGSEGDVRRSEELGPSVVQRIRDAVQRHRSHADAATVLELDNWFGDLA